MQIHWGVATDAGGRRQANEDSVLAQPPVFAVADGMGGHARGDMASHAAVTELARLAQLDRPVVPEDVTDALGRAAARIRESMAGDESVAGTTVAGAVLTEQDGELFWLVFNVGDSRVYRCTPQQIEQVSVDHSLVQEMVDSGAISRDEARHHPQRNVITRAVGTGPLPQVDFWMLRAGGPEHLVLCSDGLFGELSDAEIGEVVAAAAHPHEAAASLLERAVRDGGANDNVSAVVVAARDEDCEVAGTARRDEHEEAESTLPRAEGRPGE